MGGKEIHDIGGLEDNEIKLLIADKVNEAEKRMIVYVNDKHDHQKRNFEQAITNLTAIFTMKQEHSDDMAKRQHDESSRAQADILKSVQELTGTVDKQADKVEKINNRIYFAIGALAVIEFILQHFWPGK